MISAILTRISILILGFIYPAYSSYKAVRTKNVKEYVKWMMYWIVFALFTCIETITDIFLSWFPFYYEVKIIIVIWLLSPATKGSSTLYRKFVHPTLTRREQEIDEYINQAKEKGYTAVLQLGSKGVNYATNVIMQTALKGGGNLVQSIRRSYSLSDLSEPDVHRTQDEINDVIKPQRFLRSKNQSIRSLSGNRHSTSDMYFSEVDAPVNPNYNYIRSTEDISSGYSSAEPISGGLSRTASMTSSNRPRFKAKRSEDNETLRNFEQFPSFYNYPQFLFYSSPLQSSQISSVISDLKDETFIENEFFFQNKTEISSDNNYNNKSSKIQDIKEKYEIFSKWLETVENQKEIIDFNRRNKDIIQKQTSEDDYKDIIHSVDESGDEKFFDTEINDDNKLATEKNKFIKQNLSNDNDNEIVKVKKPAIHNKGKAPDPPNNLSVSLTELISSPTSLSLLLTGHPIENQKSRSSSPSLVQSVENDKNLKKSGIFNNYLPSIFYPELTSNLESSNSSATEDCHKETQI